ncbi:MAG: FapA family protein [Clostridiales bacterium]|nr:FapA family protein [Clostridiales bacterium]
MDVGSATGLTVRISSDEMEAYLMIPEPAPGVIYTKDDVVSALRDGRVVIGIDDAEVERMVNGRIYGREVRVAHGTKPVDGQDGFFQYNFNMDLNQKPTLRDDGSVDYWSIHAIEMVEKGQVIAVYHDPLDGVNGIAVTGRELLAKRGRPQPPLTGKGFSRAEDGVTYVADVTGKIEMVNNRIQVSAVYEVSGDVDLHTGNIDFRGDVVVHGNVRTGASVKATGTITVDGICEACTIDAGKDIVLRGGVLGAHKAVVRSKACIHAKFFEYSTVEAEGSIDLTSALSCNIVSYDRIFVVGRRANIVGGYTYASSGIEVDTLGNVNEVKTQIHVGTSAEVLKEVIFVQNRLAESNTLMEKITEGLQQFDILAREKGIDVSKDERRISLLRAKMQKQAEIATDTKALDRLNAIIERGKGIGVSVLHDVYPGTIITIDQASLVVKEQYKSIEFRKQKGSVVMMAMTDVV